MAILPASTNRRVTIETAALDRTRRRLAQVFMAQRAVTPEDAIYFSTTTPADEKIFVRMVQSGIIRDAGRHRFYLDLAAYDADIGRRRRLSMVVAVLLALVLVALAMVLYVER
ncbi:hypothetical protein [Sphingomonas sp. 28-63-12]|uniref:hypothetical protein n=1 Tax=Sphingomonas sp. 28-63-12 TaxID=1970434 RepID=UPI000BD15570|nr:MAG: hypothetical protein B7Y47_03215 [Sphingomonas sp. 28-63-12]